jgi:tetratricopeptide (TPR) repeat protein
LKTYRLILVLLIFACGPLAAAQSRTVEERLQGAANLIAEDRLAPAEQELNNVLRAAPNDARVFNLLGTIRAKQGNLNAAETFFLRAARLDRNLLGAHMNLAYLYLLKHEFEKQAFELLQVLRIDPKNQDAAYKLASLRLQQGHPDVAIEVITKFTGKNALTLPFLLILGDAYLNKGDLNQADERYRSAMSMQPASAEALLGLAQVALLRGRGAEAIDLLNRTEGLTADSADLLYKYTTVALSVGLIDKAIVAIKRAIEIKSDEPAYHLMLGIAWIRKGDAEEAELAFRDFVKARPADAQGQLYLGYILLKQKKNTEARQWIEESVKKDPTRAEAYYYLGLIAQDDSDDEKAVIWFEKAIKLQPSLTSAHTALGASFLKLKSYDQARQELEAAVKLNPDDSKAHYNLALLYARLKDNMRAKAEMEALQRLKNTGNTQAADVDAVVPAAKPR